MKLKINKIKQCENYDLNNCQTKILFTEYIELRKVAWKKNAEKFTCPPGMLTECTININNVT